MKLIVVAALAGLLAACTAAGTSTPTEATSPSMSASSSTVEMPSPSVAAMSCEDAFASVDLSGVDATTDLTTLADQLDQTIASCGSISDWMAAFQAAAPRVSVTSALRLLQARCADNADLSDTSLCALVGS